MSDKYEFKIYVIRGYDWQTRTRIKFAQNLIATDLCFKCNPNHFGTDTTTPFYLLRADNK